MLNLPESTYFGRKIPKQKFYEHGDLPAKLRRLFVEEVESIVWLHKFSADLLNVAPGSEIGEIQLLQITLRRKSAPRTLLDTICRTIPATYKLLFLLINGQEGQLAAPYCDPGQPLIWYESCWQSMAGLNLEVIGLNLDEIYTNFIRQIAGPALQRRPEATLAEEVAVYASKSELEKRAEKLVRKIRSTRQFNRQAEYSRELRAVKAELAALEGEYGKAEM